MASGGVLVVVGNRTVGATVDTHRFLSYVISQRTKSHSVTGLVLMQSMKLAAAGALAGSLLAMGVSRLCRFGPGNDRHL
jgi:hypothetical protein